MSTLIRSGFASLIACLLFSSPALGDLVLNFGASQENRGAGTYSFLVDVMNNGSSTVTVESYNLPFDLGGDGVFIGGDDRGISLNTYSVANGDGDFSSTSVNSLNPFYDILLGATATGTDEGLVLTAGERLTLFSLSLDSNGSELGDLPAATLIRSGFGASFGQFIVDGNNIFASPTEFGTEGFDGAALTASAVPEPSTFAMLLCGGVAFAVNRRRKQCSRSDYLISKLTT